ncbi:MAG: type II secretion system GspH family protein [Helicobacteraceae bacterium]|jgi:prepilin-type N-terminal cleavage/methylation domain-containing protein|nr:type II secretion system GspH family protein [Helicobacteraceae bacterium]
MKRAFTYIELIAVVVIMGVLTAVAITYFGRQDTLTPATDQIISHIRHTQHLAVMDDRFDYNKTSGEPTNYWTRYRWRIQFSDHDGWIYSIFADDEGRGNNSPSLGELAIDPLNGTYLSGGGIPSLPKTHADATPTMALKHYDINVAPNFSGCNGVQTITFDEIGRPYTIVAAPTAPAVVPQPIRLTSECKITLTHDSGERAAICIAPESGYARACDP